jgi:hypothetical protein
MSQLHEIIPFSLLGIAIFFLDPREILRGNVKQSEVSRRVFQFLERTGIKKPGQLVVCLLIFAYTFALVADVMTRKEL